jgi:squalene synthase HpnC
MTNDVAGAWQDAPELAAACVMQRTAGENFPVAPRVLPSRWREPLLAIYGFARLVDEIGDSATGDRLALLDALEDDLGRAFTRDARHPLLRRLAPWLRTHDLPGEPFARLIEANRRDQRLTAVSTWEELLAYCALSANPVGELVLRVFGCAGPEEIRLSDAVCSALQVIEHCQDVFEDHARGRVYLPAEDLARHGCATSELAGPAAGPALRRVVACELERARALLERGASLVGRLRGWARFGVAGYVAGGLAASDALLRTGCDVGSREARPRRPDLLRHAVPLWVHGALT